MSFCNRLLERIRLLDYWCCPLMRRGDIDIGWYWGSRSCLYSAHSVESIVAACQINNYPHMQLLANKKVAQIPINKLTSLTQQDCLSSSIIFLWIFSLPCLIKFVEMKTMLTQTLLDGFTETYLQTFTLNYSGLTFTNYF